MLCSVALRPPNAWKIYKRVYQIHSLGLWVAMYKIYCVGGKDLYTIPKQPIVVNIGGVCQEREVELSFSYPKSSLGDNMRAAPMAEGSLLVGIIKRVMPVLNG